MMRVFSIERVAINQSFHLFCSTRVCSLGKLSLLLKLNKVLNLSQINVLLFYLEIDYLE